MSKRHTSLGKVLALSASLAWGLWGAAAAAAAGDPSDRPPPPAPVGVEADVPEWLSPLRDREGRVSWRAISIGMEMREVANLLRVHLNADRVMEVGCGGDALEIVVDGVDLVMAFEGHGRTDKLHTLFIRADPPLDFNEAVAALKRQLPAIKPASNTEDPRPIYLVGDPEVAVMIDPRGLWLSHTMCIE